MKVQLLLVVLISVTVAEKMDLVDYDQVDLSNIEVQTFPPFDANAYAAATTQTVDANEYQFGVIRNAKTDLSVPVRSIDSLFSRVPSSHELQEIITGADSVSILRTIQNLISNDAIPCPHAFAYLLEILGRMRYAILTKEFSIAQLEVIVNAARAEIERLQTELDAAESRKANLWLDEMNDQLRDFIAQLEPLYKQFNQVEEQIAPNEARIAGFNQDIENLRKDSETQRNRLINDQLELGQSDQKIRDLENQLQLARERKAFLETSVAEAKAKLEENEAKIDDAYAQIAILEKTIRDLANQADAIRAKITTLEVRVERVRTDINVAEAKAVKINAEIADLKERIAAQERIMVEDDLALLRNQLATLNELMPTVEYEVNRQYYYCYGDGAVTIEKTGDTVVYIIRGEAFQGLLEKTYGIGFEDLVCCDDKADANAGANIPSEIEMVTVDIFSPEYQETNGKVEPNIPVKPAHPSGKETIGQNNGGSSSNVVTVPEGEFECIAEEGISGRGVIIACDGNRYTVRTYARTPEPVDQFVDVSACTIIMSTVKVPRPGMSIAFTGAGGPISYRANMMTVW